MSDVIPVAVAVIVNNNDEVCISLRHQDAHQGGLWEFPGGKVENDETLEQALKREIREELAVDIKQSRPLINIIHHYQTGNQIKTVRLHVFKVLSYQGEAAGIEGQQLKWLPVSQLSSHQFPAANLAIIKALQLPDKYLITGKFNDSEDFINKLTNALNKGIKLVQLRLKENSVNDAVEAKKLIELAAKLCDRAGAALMLNLHAAYHDSINLSKINFAGFHADSKTLSGMTQRASDKLFSASCHNNKELMRALELKADFVVLSPVKKTRSHPELAAMGWSKFSEMIENVPLPVYALGGVGENDMQAAWQQGAQGIAAISALWE